MELVLKRGLWVLAVLAAAACRNEAGLARKEQRALEESVSQAKDTAHKLDVKELGGAELTEAERAERRRLKEQAEEDENGGTAPPPPAPQAPVPNEPGN